MIISPTVWQNRLKMRRDIKPVRVPKQAGQIVEVAIGILLSAATAAPLEDIAAQLESPKDRLSALQSKDGCFSKPTKSVQSFPKYMQARRRRRTRAFCRPALLARPHREHGPRQTGRPIESISWALRDRLALRREINRFLVAEDPTAGATS